MIFGIELPEFFDQSGKPLLFKTFTHPLARLFVDGRYVVYAITHGIHIEHRTACEHQGIMLCKFAFDDLQTGFFVAGGTVVFFQPQLPHEIVLHTGLLFRCWRSGADGEVAIKLTRVGTKDGTSERLCDVKTQGRFSNARRPYNNN